MWEILRRRDRTPQLGLERSRSGRDGLFERRADEHAVASSRQQHHGDHGHALDRMSDDLRRSANILRNLKLPALLPNHTSQTRKDSSDEHR